MAHNTGIKSSFIAMLLQEKTEKITTVSLACNNVILFDTDNFRICKNVMNCWIHLGLTGYLSGNCRLMSVTVPVKVSGTRTRY